MFFSKELQRKSIRFSGNSSNTGQSISNSDQLVDYHGLINQGATCYLNSVLQVLFMTKDFREAVERNSEQVPQFIDPQLQTVFNELKKTTARTVHITRKLNVERLYEQHDAAEYFEKILSETSPKLSRAFQGQLRHRTTCSQCDTNCDENGPFWTLPLSMDTLSESYNLTNGFHEFFTTSVISGLNQMYCDQCDAKADAIIECSISRHPDVLTLLLKRFEFDYDTMSYVKVNSHVDVPQMLNSECNAYELYAIVDHSGSLRGGHYTATIKSYDNGNWYEFNDAHVRLANPQLFMKQDAVQSPTAYLLMYQKVTAPGSKITNGPVAEPCFTLLEPIASVKEHNRNSQLVDHDTRVIKRSKSQHDNNEEEQSDNKKRKVQEGAFSEHNKEVNDHDILGKKQATEEACLDMAEKQIDQGGVQLGSAEEASYYVGQKPPILQSEMVTHKSSIDSSDNDADVKGPDHYNGDDDERDREREDKVQHSKTQLEQIHQQNSVDNVTFNHKESLKIKEQVLSQRNRSELVASRRKEEGMERPKEKVRPENTQNDTDVHTQENCGIDDDEDDRNIEKIHKVHHNTQHEQMNKQTRLENEASLKDINLKEQVLPERNQSELVKSRGKDEGMERPKEKVRPENTQTEEDATETVKKTNVANDTRVPPVRDFKETVPTHGKSDKSSVKSRLGIVAHNGSNDTDVHTQENCGVDDDEDDRNIEKIHKVHHNTQHEQMNKQTRLENEASLKDVNLKGQVLPESNRSESVEIRRKDEGMERSNVKVRSEKTQTDKDVAGTTKKLNVAEDTSMQSVSDIKETLPVRVKGQQSTPKGSVKKQGCVVEDKDLRRAVDDGATAEDIPSTALLHSNTLTRSQGTETKTPGCFDLFKKTNRKRKKGVESENKKQRKGRGKNTKGRLLKCQPFGCFHFSKKRSPLVKPSTIENSLEVVELNDKPNEDFKNPKSNKDYKVNKARRKTIGSPLNI